MLPRLQDEKVARRLRLWRLWRDREEGAPRQVEVLRRSPDRRVQEHNARDVVRGVANEARHHRERPFRQHKKVRRDTGGHARPLPKEDHPRA